jgi:hypothetical protein
MIIQCDCQAFSERTEIQTESRVEDTVECKVCGHALASWNDTKIVSFKLIKNPTG